MITTAELYQQYKSRMTRIADLRYANAVLQWDQETYLPHGSAAFRGQQISTLTELSHEYFIQDELGTILQELLQRHDLSPAEQRNVERSLQDYTRNKKYPPTFVRRLSEQVNKTFHAWINARKQNSFALFEKDLDALVQLKREEAELLGYTDHPYNALVDEFERGATVKMLDKLFGDLLPVLDAFYKQIIASTEVDDSVLKQHFPADVQWNWGMYLLKQLHFDFDKGRQDKSEHPFTISFSPEDVRITTRIDENDFGNMTWSCIHELGHALYEQGLPAEHYGLPLAEACSFSMHESQSRLWENSVGRSLNFCHQYFPELKKHFPHQFVNTSAEDFYKAINKVHPSLIRTEADEITYHFHVYIRYELEKRLIERSLDARDVPAFWNEQYKQHLVVDVPDDKRGCLQDVHWSHGSFGYFPTYSLGSFYAAQIFDAAKKEVPSLGVDMSSSTTLNLLQWLRVNIHQHGRYHLSEELCEKVTGEKLNVQHFIDYISSKYKTIYNLSI